MVLFLLRKSGNDAFRWAVEPPNQIQGHHRKTPLPNEGKIDLCSLGKTVSYGTTTMNNSDEGVNLDSLMDALTNVVAVLILVLVLVQADVSRGSSI